MPPKYRVVHRYGKWHVVEYTPKEGQLGVPTVTYTSKTIVQPTTKKLAEAYMKLLKE
jgi:hypothetical protein